MNQITEYITRLQQTLTHMPTMPIEEAIHILHEARLAKRTVFIMGNGGSASTASHFVCDLAKNTRTPDRADSNSEKLLPDFRVLALTDNVASITAYANDEGYDQIFARQLSAFVQPRDVVIAISTSGNSPNVLEAVRAADAARATIISFTGFDGGQLATMADLNLHVPSNIIEHVEDIHLVLEHLICSVLRDMAAQALKQAPPPAQELVNSSV